MQNHRIVLAVVLISLIILVGFTFQAKSNDNDNRFERIYCQQLGQFSHIEIIHDTKTNDSYLFYKEFNAGGLTRLETTLEEQMDEALDALDEWLEED